MKTGASHFTTLQTFYAINEELLRTRERTWKGWFSNGEKINKQVRPDEKDIDNFYEELAKYWDAILEAIPELHLDPLTMRYHDIDEPSDESQDHLLFWPIGQELFAKLVRNILDDKFPEDNHAASVEEMAQALKPLAQIPWELHNPPWRHILLVRTSSGNSWRMRSEDRKSAIEIARRILRWLVNLDPHNNEETEELRNNWMELLYDSSIEETEIDKMWNDIVKIRKNIVTNP